MRYLLDTHVWIWSLLEPSKLTKATTMLMTDSQNSLFLSPISVWETLILIEKNRLQVTTEPVQWVQNALRSSPVRQIALTNVVAIRSRQIQLPHQDPADRFIAATAIEYGLTLITADNWLLSSSDLKAIHP